MSSLFTVAEIALATLGLAATAGDALEVVVGGLGLGYTAAAALEDPRVVQLHVIEALGEVIGWHEAHLVPLGAQLAGDERCHLRQADFFALVRGGKPLLAGSPDGRCDVVLLDVDHTPRHVLHPSHASFYEPAGLALLADQLRPGGVFALWSDDPPDEPFLGALREVFATTEANVVEFPNHHTGGAAANTIYVATASTD